MLEFLTQPKSAIYWLVAALFGIATAAIHLTNFKNRSDVDAALKVAAGVDKPFLAMKSLCGDEQAKAKALNESVPIPPERLWCYDKNYLVAFHRVASAGAIQTHPDKTILDHYIRPTLLWNDVSFAIGLGVFTALVLLGVASYAPWSWLRYVFAFCGCMGLAYGIIDVIEDVRLAKLLREPTAISDGGAAVLNLVTRAKIATLIASGLGGVTFLLLQKVGDAFIVGRSKD